MDLRRLSMSVNWFKDEHDIQYLLQNAKKLRNSSYQSDVIGV